MSKRFELGMSLNYVEEWGIVEAVREIFQNALDEEIVNEDNKMFISYENNILRIGNKNSSLSSKTLLLGISSKREDSKTIGTHGEGYKVATIVLLRNNIGVRILNYCNKEIWTAKVIKSKRYGCKIGVYDIDSYIFKKNPNANLIFELDGITPEMYNEIRDKILWLQDNLGEVVESTKGRILKDKRFVGKIFIKGLYVCDNKYLTYGYDLNPESVTLDRDRGLIDNFDLKWAIAELIIGTKDLSAISELKDKYEGAYISSSWFSSEMDEDLRNKICDDEYEKFVKEYGNNAIPTTDTIEFNSLARRNYCPVMVTESSKFYITQSKKYTPVQVEESDDIYSLFENWGRKYLTYISDTGKKEFESLLKKLQVSNNN